MTGFSIRIEVDDAKARRNLEELLARMANPRPFYQAVGNLLVASVGRNFQREAGPDGAPWTPLRPATIRKRQRRGLSGLAILRERGRLAGSIFHQVEEGGVRIGVPSGIRYGAIHQFGGTIDMAPRTGRIYRRQFADGSFGRRFAKKKNKTSVATEVVVGAHRITIPARPFLGIGPEDEADIIEAARRWLDIA
ncbi:MAG: phage virion morphogenesis protein [Albidovulum sp.]|jgi:phage virion morphogenesis protein